MRKSLTLFLCLLLLMIAGLGAAAVTVKEQETAASTSQTCYYGDPKYAEGIVVKERFRSMNRLFWTTRLEAGESPSVTAEFEMSTKDVYEDYDYERPALVTYFQDVPDIFCAREYMTELDKAARRLVDSAPNDKQSSFTLNYADIFDYYPLETYPYYVSGYAEQVWVDGSGKEYNEYSPEFNATLGNILSEYIRVPVLENHSLSIDVYKDKSGSIVDYNTTIPDGCDGADLQGYSCSSEDFIFFTISNKSWNGQTLDTSLIPGGYGIYAIPRIYDEARNKTLVYLGKIFTAYSFDESEEISKLITSLDGKSVLCLSCLGGESYLTVLEADSGKLRQRTKISGVEDEFSVWSAKEQSDGSLLCMDENSIALIEKNSAGIYEQTAAVAQPIVRYDNEEEVYYITEEGSAIHEAFDYTDIFIESASAKRIGNRLVVADSFMYHSDRSCSLTLFVYEDSELKYIGYYSSSLDVADIGTDAKLYSRLCTPDGYSPITIMN